ncbi:putative ABC transporter permease [Arabiibacter massiliensis]|uniref:putative ABC transporter permease n=1 Tax=Arabiibacter massiliensis TaxID=1870985 RepID=UPI0009BBA40B|nr:putative ABC transporter permease [Arabiibacter massiliensis]
MTKDFSNPKKLGFMRLLQVFFAINIVLTISLLVFVVKGGDELGFGEILDFVNLVFDGVSFWLIWQRKRLARHFIIAFSLFNIVVGSIYNLATGQFDLIDQLLASASDIILLAYFLTSRRAKAVLTRPFSAEIKRADLERHVDFYRPRTWAFWRNLIIYFCVFSVVGHWMEAGYCTLIRFGLIPGIYDPNSQIWSDWLYPFCVYGFGAVACVLLLFPVKNFLQRHIKAHGVPLVLSFVVNALVCTLIELAMGLMLNQPLPDGTLPLWDYRDMFCNFMGQVCLQNAVAFGVVATLTTWVIYPGLETFLARFSKDVMNVAFIAVVIAFCILFFFYCVNILLPDLDDDELFDDAPTEQVQPASEAGGAG